MIFTANTENQSRAALTCDLHIDGAVLQYELNYFVDGQLFEPEPEDLQNIEACWSYLLADREDLDT
jgi:hypothetical protein